jgi:phosphate transport system protein
VSHYQERLEKDLGWIDQLVQQVGSHIEQAIGAAVKAVLKLDKELAATTIIGDYLVNRQTRELDRLCHVFVARHLPSAGHLRYVSSVMRLSIALERVGDYSATVSRTAAQLSSVPPPIVAHDIEMMCEHARRLLREGLRSFQARDPGLAQATLAAAAQFVPHFDKVFADLVREAEQGSRPVTELFSFLATFNRLERVIHQAKNVCEETLFVATGRQKGEKVFQLLFLDERNDGPSQLAEHFTRKAFPQSGRYRSAGWAAADEIDKSYVAFAQQVGLDLGRAWPTALSTLKEQLADFHFVIGLSPAVHDILPKPPFHTTVVGWNIDTSQPPEAVYRQLTPLLRELMEKLRGEAAS